MYKARSGKIVGYNAPYGYTYNKETGSFDINESEAEVVRKMFEWVAHEGLSTYGLINRLHNQGIMPPKNKGEYWSRSPIARILNNETYIGKHHFNKTESILPRSRKESSKYRKIQKTGRRVRSRDEWIEFEVKPIISKELFKNVRVQLDRNSKFNPKNRKHQYLLTGLVKCTCGANRNGDGPAGKKYYRCTSRNKTHPIVNQCKVGGLNVVVADNTVWNKVSELLSSPELIRKHAERWLTQQKSVKAVSSEESLNSRLTALQDEQRRYVEAYGKGIMPELLFSEKMNETNKQLDAINKDITNASANRGILAKIDIEQLIRSASQKIDTLEFEQRKYIIERVIDKIIASPKEITIWGHLPTQSLAFAGKVNHGSQHRNRRPAKRW